MTFVIVCAIMVVGHADVRTNAEDDAYREIHKRYIDYGKSIHFADCVEQILRHKAATDDFQDFEKIFDPETNSNRLVDHIQGKVTNSMNMLCDNKIISLCLAVVLLIVVIGILICLCANICC